MGRFLFGFFIAALVFNTSATVDFVADTAQVIVYALGRAGEAGEDIWNLVDTELVKREVLPPKEQRAQ